MEQENLSPQEAARILRVHPETVLALVRAGKLRSYRVGRAIRIRMEWLRAFEESGGARDTAREVVA